MSAFSKKITESIFDEYERLNLWFVVFFVFGIILYFKLPFEPALLYGIVAVVLSGILFFFFRKKEIGYLLTVLLLFGSLGFLRIQLQTRWTEHTFLQKSYPFSEVVGRIEKIEHFPSAVRLTLDVQKIDDKIPVEERPQIIRVRINGKKNSFQTGDVIELKASLSPPMLPTFPDGYPFSRKAYFEKIGAVGFAVSKVSIINKKPPSFTLDRMRQAINSHFADILDKKQAAIASALVIGEQKEVPQTVYNTYTQAGIVHILSVSGFHMMLIAGFIFFWFRFLFSLFPKFCERFNTKKISAVIALLVTFLYLLISGAGIPAMRAFITILFVLTAILLDKRALSIRNVCWSAFVLLLIHPENLMTASFALSFSAVLVLVAGFESLKTPIQHFIQKRKKFLRPAWALFLFFFLTNTLAHLATAPSAIYYFHRYANYALLGNLLTSFLFSLFIMPLLFLGTMLMPLGWDVPFIKLAGIFLRFVDWAAERVSSLPYANLTIHQMDDWAYFIMIFGIIWLCLWQKRKRFLGLIPLSVGVVSLFFFTPPDILVSQGGKLFAYRKENNQYVFSLSKSEKWTRQQWTFALGIDESNLTYDATSPISYQGKTISFMDKDCTQADISFGKCHAPLFFPYRELWRYGTHALYFDTNDKIKIRRSADGQENRPWGIKNFPLETKSKKGYKEEKGEENE